MNVKPILFLLFSIIALLSSCKPTVQHLPYLGSNKIVDGEEVRHQIRSFNYIDQDSVAFNADVLNGNIYLADFFFTSCPSICPRVMKNMLRVQEKYKDILNFKLVSFSLDPKRDTPARMKKYAENIGADLSMWHFVHGPKDSIMAIANEDYYVPAFEDPDAPGGFDHSGKLLLIDGNGHLRGFAEGTEDEDVTEFFNTIDALLAKSK